MKNKVPNQLENLVPASWPAALAAFPWLDNQHEGITETYWIGMAQDERTAWILENLHAERPGNLAELPTETIARLVAGGIREIHSRWQQERERSLEEAKKVWPELRAALRQQGRKLGLNDFAEPTMTDWADQPVVAMEGHYGRKPKTKQRAMEIALHVGDGSWATIGELWLWVGGGGPIVTRTLQRFGFLPGPPEVGYKRTDCGIDKVLAEAQKAATEAGAA